MGDLILAESAECLRAVVLANAVDKTSRAGSPLEAGKYVECRQEWWGFLLLAWQLKFVSHGGVNKFRKRAAIPR